MQVEEKYTKNNIIKNLTSYKRHDILYKYVEKTKQSYTLTSAHVLMRLGFIYRSTAVNAVDVTCFFVGDLRVRFIIYRYGGVLQLAI